MGLSDFKIKDSDISQKGVVAAPDKLTGTAAQNKAIFDRLIREVVKERFNGMVDALEADISEYLGEPEQNRRAAEEQRAANERERVTNERERADNEDARVAAEQARGELLAAELSGAIFNGAVAPIESAPAASHAYAAGNQLIYQNRLYDVIAPIAAGDHLSVGGNIVPTDGETSSVGELEDLTVRCGRFVNAGEGWQGFAFPTGFDAPPVLTAQPLGFGGWVELRDVTAEGFSYRLRRNVFRAGEWSAGSVSEGEVSANKYFTASAAAASSAHTEQKLVDGVTLPEIVLPELTLPTAATADTDEPVTVCWIAMEFNGEEENQ